MKNERKRGMTRASHFRLYPTLTQKRQLAREFGTRRWVWNFSLGAISDAWS
jgi:hypothetical protein